MIRPRESTSTAGAPGGANCACRFGFTLTEMIVVVAIVVILIGVVMPAVNAMWEDRKITGAENTIRGALMVAHRQAMSPGHNDTGLLFALDARGTQHLYLIEQRPAGQRPEDALLARDRFVVTERVFTLPPPMRAVPRYVVDKESLAQDEKYRGFSPEELANNEFPIPPSPIIWQEPQRHRNYFSMVFSTDGELILGRNVLIYDEDEDAPSSGETYGDRTGMLVSREVLDFFERDSSQGASELPIDPDNSGLFLEWLVTDEQDGIAINFPSVDGVLLYDDSVFKEMGLPEDKRDALLEMGVPLYVVGPACSIVRGPLGENVLPQGSP